MRRMDPGAVRPASRSCQAFDGFIIARTEGYWAVPNEKCLKHRSAGDTVAGGATSTAKVKTLMHCPSWLVGNNSP